MSRQSTKNKKYALRKIGKFFGSCAVATLITLGGAAIIAPSVTVYASGGNSDGDNDIHNLGSSGDGYEVIIPKGKKYIRNDEIESHTPVLKEEGYNGRSFIVKSDSSLANPSELFEKLYDKDGDGEIDDKYKDPKYPHVVDSGLTDDSESSSNKPGVWEYKPDGKYENSDGEIDENDNIVVARKPFTINEDAENNVVNDDGSVVLNGDYNIHVNEGDHIEAKDDVYEVGTKPKVERTPIPFETTYKRDDSVPEGTEEEVTAGKNGETVKTTTYELNPTTGEVTANEPTSVTTDPVTRVVKKGTQPKVEKTPIPFETTYKRDDSVPEGTEEEVTAGKNGETVKTTTYELNPTTGEVTANEPTSVTTDPVTRVVKKGTQPKVEKTPIPFETRYEEDNSIPEGEEREVTAGVNGETVKTTTYELNPTTGEVTANEPKTATTDPVTRVVKRGTQPKPGETPETPQPKPGETPETPQPKPGETPETPQPKPGETPETPQPKPGETPETPQPKPGETPETPQPKPGETPETPQPKPGETPETPQPGQPTTPEEAPAQPGQPSEPEDQPDLKVAPPTIAIVEEPNKASFEVKAPKKDADTVKIIYPKSNGSGNEVLTLTKQPTGEWTLDKQPENVTLDKKTGTVTIPRESVVNKQKVKAQAKHKTSNYTPFVYAALSIEAANPEHPVTLWVDTAGKEIKEKVVGKKVQAGEIAGYKWLSSRLEEGILTHTFEKVANGTPILPESPTSHPMTPSSSPSTSTPEKPNKAETPAVRTVWRDENGKDLKVPSVDKEEAGEVPGYEFVESHREGDNLTVHVFRTKQAQTPAPKDQTPSPAPSKVSEQKGEAVATATSEKTVDSVTSTKTSDKAELPNTGTESNASLASAGIMTLLAGLGLGFFKKKEDEK